MPPSLHEPLFTIIIPNFNKKEYVADALSSVLSQSFRDFEIIIVDDASTDGSYEICQDFADLDERVRLYRMKENSLQGVCRNIAVKHAKGKYFVCVDSDDLLHPGFLSFALNDMERENADMIAYSTQEVDESGNVVRKIQVVPKILEYGECVTAFWGDKLPWGPWGKVYNTEFVRSNGIKFAEYIYHQDVFFINDIARKARKIVLAPQCVYSVRLSPNSSIRPAKFRYVHLKSAIAKMHLRDTVFMNGEVALSWEYMAKAQIWSFQKRLLPALGRAWAINRPIFITPEDFRKIRKSPAALFTMLTNFLFKDMHVGINTQAAEKISTSQPGGLIQILKKFSLPPVDRLQRIASLRLPDNNDGGFEKDADILRLCGVFDPEYYVNAYDDLKK